VDVKCRHGTSGPNSGNGLAHDTHTSVDLPLLPLVSRWSACGSKMGNGDLNA
jgi:hypothetical protein